MGKRLLKTFIISFVCCAILLLLQKIFAQDIKEAMMTLCNTFFCVGVMLLCIGGISFCADKGEFDIFGYAGSNFFGSFKRNYKSKYANYAEYVAEKHKPGKKKNNVIHYLIVGGSYSVLSLVFLLIYNGL